ncbi:hypothetical protein V1264_018433 [Littorina saxatilis]|uniref:E2F-associated phosphoprotein n=1 Tax=Littorina saxatilis TaxID=31220 RepID=A0AAN9BCS5_9CAEN
MFAAKWPKDENNAEGDESDQERAESSEDEIDIILHGTSEQRKRLRHIHQKEQQQKSGQQSRQSRPHKASDGHESSSEDEFEREMNAELEKTVYMLEKSRAEIQMKEKALVTSKASAAEGKQEGDSSAAENIKKSFYNDMYFDSDDDENYEGEGDAKIPKQHTQPSNDDLLYDPDMDDEDQKWVDQQRKQHYGSKGQAAGNRKRGSGNKMNSIPKSDAVLDCPACMTTLCLDCQRHEIYPTQYRAMFVMNCKVNTGELLSVPERAAKKKFKKSKQSSGKTGEGSGNTADQNDASKDNFHPVKCEECDTVVGVVDTEEVYHFFNVLVSQP